MIRKLNPQDKLDFGKNKGLSLEYIFKYQPSYIEWAIENIPNFKVDIDEFRKLPNPTPMCYNPNSFTKAKSKKELNEMSEEELFDAISTSDTINQMKNFGAMDSEKSVTSENFGGDEIPYEFPQRIIEINNIK